MCCTESGKTVISGFKWEQCPETNFKHTKTLPLLKLPNAQTVEQISEFIKMYVLFVLIFQVSLFHINLHLTLFLLYYTHCKYL